MTENKQYYRTHRAIQSAFLTLLSQKSFDKITVQDILDTTPVSRATFYKHFRDKHDLAEKLQEEIVHAHIELCDTLVREGPMNMAALAERFTIRYQDMGSLLMTIQTDSVNLPQALELSLREYYMEHHNSPNRELESKIYAAAFSAFLIAGLDKSNEVSPMQMPAVMLPVFLSLLGLQGDPDVTKVIMQKYSSKFGS